MRKAPVDWEGLNMNTTVPTFCFSYRILSRLLDVSGWLWWGLLILGNLKKLMRWNKQIGWTGEKGGVVVVLYLGCVGWR